MMERLELGGEPYARPAAWTGIDIIDADVHCSAPGMAAVAQYLDERWRDYLLESGTGGAESNLYPARVPGVFLSGSATDEHAAGTNLAVLQAQLLEPWETKIAVLNPTFSFDRFHNVDLVAALTAAANTWMLEQWLRLDPRLRGSAIVPLQNPEAAVAEIERVAQHPEFVQIVVPCRTREPLGRRRYWPILEAASKAGLPIAVQAGGISGNPITPIGWPSLFIEDYVGVSQAFQSQMLSLVSEGVFTRFPDLKIVFLESGFTWLPALMWRFDKNWKGLRREVPWVEEYPSEIIRKHFRIATQPLDAPAVSTQLLEMIDQIESDEMLLFSTDYPHRQFNSAAESLPIGLLPQQLNDILNGNACRFYNF